MRRCFELDNSPLSRGNAWTFGCGEGTFWRQVVDQNGSQDGDCGSKELYCHHEQEVEVYALSGYYLLYNDGCIPPDNNYTVAPATTGYPDDQICGDTWLDPTGEGYATVWTASGCNMGPIDCDGNTIELPEQEEEHAKIYVLFECNPCSGPKCGGGGGPG